MVRRSPSEIYLKYLILHPNKFTNEDIKAACNYVQLDYLNNNYLERLRAGMVVPKGFTPFNKSHYPSYSLLAQHGLVPIFFPEKPGKVAFDMLRRPRVKEFIESMTLSGAPLTAIAHTLTTQRDFTCEVKHLQTYKSFFWDMENVDSTEMRVLLQMRIDRLAEHPDDDVKAQIPALKRAFWNDPRRLAADLPSSPWMSVVAQMKMGLMPSRIDVAKTIDMAMNVISIRVLEAATSNGLNDASRTLEYANSLRIVKEVADVLVRPDDKLQKDLAQLGIRTSDKKIPTIHQLSKGAHTAEVIPVEKNYVPVGAEFGDDGDSGEGDLESAD